MKIINLFSVWSIGWSRFLFVVKHPDQIVYGSRPRPSALRPYCSNGKHPSVDSLQKGHGHCYQNYMEIYSEEYILN